MKRVIKVNALVVEDYYKTGRIIQKDYFKL